ncbi:MAG: hypothetical protein ACMXYB_04055 [Candidatus Woesearchaeota archaeon]
MVNKHMNFFVPYTKNNQKHEDHLTRSLLLLLKYSNEVRSAFYELVRLKVLNNNYFFEKETNYKIPSIYNIKKNSYWIDTQISNNRADTYYDEEQKIISILLTDAYLESNFEDSNLTDRSGIFDGFFKIDFTSNYDSEESSSLVFIMENKPFSKNVYKEQLKIPTSRNIDRMNQFITITWKEIIVLIRNLNWNLSEKNLLFEDFFEFIFSNYPTLFPYDSFEHCKQNKELIEMRIQLLLQNIISKEFDKLNIVEKHGSWAYKIILENFELNKGVIKQIDYPYYEEKEEIGIFLLFGTTIPNSRELSHYIDNTSITINHGKSINIEFIFRITDAHGRSLIDIKIDEHKKYEFIEFWNKSKKLTL